MNTWSMQFASAPSRCRSGWSRSSAFPLASPPCARLADPAATSAAVRVDRARASTPRGRERIARRGPAVALSARDRRRHHRPGLRTGDVAQAAPRLSKASNRNASAAARAAWPPSRPDGRRLASAARPCVGNGLPSPMGQKGRKPAARGRSGPAGSGRCGYRADTNDGP
jgi:hypothetical protein